MLKSGTTCFLDPICDEMEEFTSKELAVERMGIRGCLGIFVGPLNMSLKDDRPSGMSIEDAVGLHIMSRDSVSQRLRVWLCAPGPTADNWFSDRTFYEAVDRECKAFDIRLTLHATEHGRGQQLVNQCYGATQGHLIREDTMMGPHILLPEMIHPSEYVRITWCLTMSKTNLAHNPTSHCKRTKTDAIGELLAYINVALGTDSAAASHTFDLFREMHAAGMTHKGPLGCIYSVPSEQILEMATINGAKALGLEKDIGSLEVGKKADFVVVNPFGVHAAPYHPTLIDSGGLNPVATVVHSCTASDVSLVVVDGVVLVRDGKLTINDEGEIIQKARDAIRRLRERHGGAQRRPLRRGWSYV